MISRCSFVAGASPHRCQKRDAARPWPSRAFAAALIASTPLIFGDTAFAQLKGADRDQFVEGVVSGCVKTAPEHNRSSSEIVIQAYCKCVGNKLADIMTADELNYYKEHHTRSDDFAQRAKVIQKACAA